MSNVSRKQRAVDDFGPVLDTLEDIPEEEAQRKPPDGDGVVAEVWLTTSVLSVPASILGGLIVAGGHGLALGLAAGFVGLVVGQVVSVAIASRADATDSEWRSLADLPADQRVGSGLMTRRKEKRADVAMEVAGALTIILSAPVATLLTALLIGWIAGD